MNVIKRNDGTMEYYFNLKEDWDTEYINYLETIKKDNETIEEVFNRFLKESIDYAIEKKRGF